MAAFGLMGPGSLLRGVYQRQSLEIGDMVPRIKCGDVLVIHRSTPSAFGASFSDSSPTLGQQ